MNVRTPSQRKAPSESGPAMRSCVLFAAAALFLMPRESWSATSGGTAPSVAPFPDWSRSGSLFILTTPDGANLPAAALERDFPVLVRLHPDYFDFGQAKPNGEDVRFSTGTGVPLAFQVEEWDAARGTASIWVRVPEIRGNARQELRMHWGKADAASGSDGASVFGASNGYLSVWHMTDPVRDEVGSLASKDAGTVPTPGIVGPARRLAGGQGVFGGDAITNFPMGAAPHTSEAWFRSKKPNTTIVGWGNEHGQGKVVMQLRSPPHVNMDCYFSGASVASRGALPLGEWIQVVHTWLPGDSRIYVNGVLDGVSTRSSSPLAIKSPARLWLGGWYHHYDFVGDLDEVRVSRVARSADWVRLQHENQKPLQTLIGPLVQPGDAFGVSPSVAEVLEGGRAEFTAAAGGAWKVQWIEQRDGRETVVATDRFRYAFEAGRVTRDTAVTLRFRAVHSDGVRTQDIPIAIREAIPEPVFTLNAPASWDGRETIEVVPLIANEREMQARGAGALTWSWSVSGLAVIREVAGGRLRLKRAQNSGDLTVTATVHNGGKPSTRAVTLRVQEPERDAWVERMPTADEKPQDNQFYARDDRNQGTLFCNGTLQEAADTVFLRLYADDALVATRRAEPAKDQSYALSVVLKPGLIRYRVEFGTTRDGRETVRHAATNLVCGDAYLIDGQSNALATDTGEESPAVAQDWIRSYGSPPDDVRAAAGNLWCSPVWKARKGEKAELGWWGMQLAQRLLESQQVPIFLLNAAVGGTRIDQHQRNETDPADRSSLYGRMLWRVREARLTHGIRAILWHQGENDQGADGPTGGYGWETYQPLFVEMASGWKRDFPNVQHYYVFQIWPDSCSMGGRNGSGDMLREQQRTLPRLFSRLSLMSTLGIRPPGGCHFPLAGWGEFARLIQPLIERDHYGRIPAASVTPPNLRHAWYVDDARDRIALEFDQPVLWDETLAGQFYPDGETDRVASGRIEGNVLTLRLKGPSAATRITYLKESRWSQDRLLLGANGLPALTFCNVPLQPGRPKAP